MIRSIDDSKLKEIEEACSHLFLTAHDKNILRDITNILSPFEEMLRVDNVPSVGYHVHHPQPIRLKSECNKGSRIWQMCRN